MHYSTKDLVSFPSGTRFINTLRLYAYKYTHTNRFSALPNRLMSSRKSRLVALPFCTLLLFLQQPRFYQEYLLKPSANMQLCTNAVHVLFPFKRKNPPPASPKMTNFPTSSLTKIRKYGDRNSKMSANCKTVTYFNTDYSEVLVHLLQMLTIVTFIQKKAATTLSHQWFLLHLNVFPSFIAK